MYNIKNFISLNYLINSWSYEYSNLIVILFEWLHIYFYISRQDLIRLIYGKKQKCTHHNFVQKIFYFKMIGYKLQKLLIHFAKTWITFDISIFEFCRNNMFCTVFNSLHFCSTTFFMKVYSCKVIWFWK